MLSPAEIKKFIDDDIASDKKKLAKIGQNYYEGNHDIYKMRFFYFDDDGNLKEDNTRSNVKIAHTFFTELVDQLVYYLLSSEKNPIRAKETAEGLQEHLDGYFNAKFWVEAGELITGAQVKGFEYIFAYKGKDNRLIFQTADSLGVVEVRAKETDDNCEYIIFYYTDRISKSRKIIRRIQVWSETETWYYVQEGKNGKIVLDDAEEINPRPHIVGIDKKTGIKKGLPLGYIPFWRLDNNRKQVSSLKPVKDLIDDYDIMACSLSNNLIDFDTPIHVVKGYEGQNLNELITNLKTKKTIGVDADGGIDVSTVAIPYEARKAKLEIDEKAIYHFGFGLNTTGLKDTNATTNLAIQTAYSLLEIRGKKMKQNLEALLDDLIPVVLDEINKEHSTGYKMSDIEYNFQPTIMANETENIQNEKVKAETKQIEINTILNVASTLDDETVVKSICDVLDIDYEEIKDKLPKSPEGELIAAQTALNGAVVD